MYLRLLRHFRGSLAALKRRVLCELQQPTEPAPQVVKVRLLKGWNWHRPGALLTVGGGVADTLIRRRAAELYVPPEQPETAA